MTGQQKTSILAQIGNHKTKGMVIGCTHRVNFGQGPLKDKCPTPIQVQGIVIDKEIQTNLMVKWLNGVII